MMERNDFKFNCVYKPDVTDAKLLDSRLVMGNFSVYVRVDQFKNENSFDFIAIIRIIQNQEGLVLQCVQAEYVEGDDKFHHLELAVNYLDNYEYKVTISIRMPNSREVHSTLRIQGS